MPCSAAPVHTPIRGVGGAFRTARLSLHTSAAPALPAFRAGMVPVLPSLAINPCYCPPPGRARRGGRLYALRCARQQGFASPLRALAVVLATGSRALTPSGPSAGGVPPGASIPPFGVLQADFPPPRSAKPLVSTGLDGDLGFHAGGYMLTCNKLSISSCSGVGMLF